MSEMLKTTHQFGAKVSEVLNLVIHSIYTKKEIFLRELVSNALDALEKARFFSLRGYDEAGNHVVALEDSFAVKISLNPTESQIIIEDNGIGMDEQDLIDNLGTIASSGTQKFLQSLQEAQKKQGVELIGQFGVGFYSAFMVAERVTVFSSKLGQSKSYCWESAGTGEFTVAEMAEKLPRGTKIVLQMKSSEAEFLDKYRVKHLVTSYSSYAPFPIELCDKDGEVEVLNQKKALWLQKKEEISEDDYADFYQEMTFLPGKPQFTLHNQVESPLFSYNSLIFVPLIKPYDLFHPDRRGKIKLYVKRVYIAEHELEILPAYLRFLRGVVETNDLPLNISRETLQHNNILQKISKSIAKKFFSEMKRKLTQEAEEYRKFWHNFGEVLKEGLCERFSEETQQILEICLFSTLNAPEEMMTLEQYIENMRESQEAIYYISGDNRQALLKNPKLEAFKAQGIDVILLSEHVDDFWINVVRTFKNKELKSIDQADKELLKPQKKQGLETGEDPEKDKSAANEETLNKDVGKSAITQENQELLDFVKKVLEGRIKDAVISHKLVTSPSCLALPEGAMNIRMEKMLIEQNQLKQRSKKILELNTEHELIRKIAKLVQEKQEETAKNLVEIVFYQACLIEREFIDDPSDFVAKINTFLAKIN